MFNLIKYEFRKNIVIIVALLSILLGLECYYLWGFQSDKLEHMIVAIGFLVITTVVSFFMVFVLGISNYEKELQSKSCYLIFMTPNSALKIILSKLIYILLLGSFCAVVIGGLAFFDIKLFGITVDEQYHFMDFIEAFSEMFGDLFGISFDKIWATFLLGIIYVVLGVFSTLTIAYLAITLATTLLQSNRFRKLISAILFIALIFVVNYIDAKFIHSNKRLIRMDQVWGFILPSLIYHAIVMVACTFGCSELIKRALSL